MSFRCLGVAWVVANLVSACSPGPVPVAQSSRDPSNPSAPEGMLASAAVASRSNDTTRSADTSREPPDAGVSGTYVCPMHPEVISAGPGRCPKCGMNLVPKK
jgi:Heavy metal binding domain